MLRLLSYLGYVLSAIFGILAVILFLLGSITNPTAKKIIVAVYTIVPPLWFWFEYTFFYSGADFEAFKYRQELNRNIWVAVTTVLVVMYFKDPD